MEEDEAFPLEQLSPELKLIVFSHLPGKDLLALHFVCKDYYTLAKSAYLSRGREHKEEVVVIQKWWQDRKDTALEYLKPSRRASLNSLLHSAHYMAEGKNTCLQCRKQILALIKKEAEQGTEKEKDKEEESSAIKKLWRKASGLFGSSTTELPPNPFTKALINKLFPKKLLKPLCAVLNKFEQLLKEFAEEWDKEEQGFEQRLSSIIMYFLEYSREPLRAYLQYLNTEKVQDDVLNPLLGIDSSSSYLGESQPPSLIPCRQYWQIFEDQITSVIGPAVAVPVTGEVVYGNRIGATIGWTSMIYRVKYISESCGKTLKRGHPDRRAFEKKVMPLLEKYFALYDKEQTEEKAQLCYY